MDNYEKRYKEALEQAKKDLAQSGPDSESARQILRFFPELTDSEDERIRKVIHKILLAVRKDVFIAQDEIVTKDKALAYIERQKEQEHPDGCFTCDEYKKGYEAGRLNGLTAGYNKAKKEQNPAEWSEEDKKTIIDACCWLEAYACLIRSHNRSRASQIFSLANKLKSLQPQPQWRPSEEQMRALKNSAYSALQDLYKHFKKP